MADDYVDFGNEDEYSRRQVRVGRGHIKRSRRIPMLGDGDGEANWSKCWSCGMACNDVTDQVDDGASKVHTTHRDYPTEALGKVTGSMNIIMGGELNVVKVAEISANGDTKEVVHAFKIVNTKGCPNDGNLNWIGNH